MKTRAELAKAVCEAAKIYVDIGPDAEHEEDASIRANEALSELTVAVYAWRNTPPDPPELKITPGPVILSPSDRLSEEEVWMRAAESCLRSQTLPTHRVVFEADGIVNAFCERFRKEKL